MLAESGAIHDVGGQFTSVSSAPAATEGRPSKVIYHIYVSSFNDSNGDGIGDLPGIIEKLDYLQSLGIDAVWLAPVYPSPKGPEGDGGYAVTDRRGIDPRFGTLDDMKALLKEAHKRGIEVYLDDVLPHTSSDQAWFLAGEARQHPYEDFHIWHDGIVENGQRKPPNNWLSAFGGGGWEWSEKRGQYYFHHFLKSQPALNLNNPKVQDAVLADMKFWLDMGVDGFRYDSLSYANYDPAFRDNSWMNGGREWKNQRFDSSHCQPQTVEFVRKIRQLMDSYPKHKTTLGEVICGRDGGGNPMPVAAEYVDRKNGLDMCYTDAFRAINHKTGHGYLQGVIRDIIHHFPDGGHCNALGNHDSPRMASRDMDHIPEHYREKAHKQLVKLMACLPGSLSIFQGEELGLDDARIPDDIPHHKIKDPVAQTKGIQFCRDGSRTPMVWHSGRAHAGFSKAMLPYLPVPDRHYNMAVNVQEQDVDSMLSFMKRLISWRKENPALVHGRARLLDTQYPLVALIRECRDQTMLCVFNMSDRNVMFKPSDLLDQKTLDALSVSREEVLDIKPYGSSFRGADPLACQVKVVPALRLAAG